MKTREDAEARIVATRAAGAASAIPGKVLPCRANVGHEGRRSVVTPCRRPLGVTLTSVTSGAAGSASGRQTAADLDSGGASCPPDHDPNLVA